VIQPNNELSTGLYPIKEPTQEELAARRDLDARLATENSEDAITARVRKLVEDAAALKAMREQSLEGPKQSPEVEAYINRAYEKDSTEVLDQIRRLASEPESAK
jgi:hypothetical protein